MNHAATKYSLRRGDKRQPRCLHQEIAGSLCISQGRAFLVDDSHQDRIGFQPQGIQQSLTCHRPDSMDTTLCSTLFEGRYRPKADCKHHNGYEWHRAVGTYSGIFSTVSGPNDRPVSDLPSYFFTECIGQARIIHNRQAA